MAKVEEEVPDSGETEPKEEVETEEDWWRKEDWINEVDEDWSIPVGDKKIDRETMRELIRGNLRQQAFTQKTMSLAEERKAFEKQRDEILSKFDPQKLTALQAVVDYMAAKHGRYIVEKDEELAKALFGDEVLQAKQRFGVETPERPAMTPEDVTNVVREEAEVRRIQEVSRSALQGLTKQYREEYSDLDEAEFNEKVRRATESAGRFVQEPDGRWLFFPYETWVKPDGSPNFERAFEIEFLDKEKFKKKAISEYEQERAKKGAAQPLAKPGGSGYGAPPPGGDSVDEVTASLLAALEGGA